MARYAREVVGNGERSNNPLSVRAIERSHIGIVRENRDQRSHSGRSRTRTARLVRRWSFALARGLGAKTAIRTIGHRNSSRIRPNFRPRDETGLSLVQ